MLDKMTTTSVEEDGTSSLHSLQCSRCKDPKKRADRMKYLVGLLCFTNQHLDS